MFSVYKVFWAAKANGKNFKFQFVSLKKLGSAYFGATFLLLP
jgi:hypothetical protein